MKEIVYKYTNTGVYPVRYIARRNYNTESQKNLNKGFKTLGVSEQTQKKIRIACQVLSYAAKERKVRNSKGEYIKHLGMFITLTLPYEQKHTDTEITKTILGTFLDKCRKLKILENYVWRAEKQKNGNIHYHVLTDSFANYSMIYRLWKIALEQFNYVTAYSEKFKKISLREYIKLNHNRNKSINEVTEKYAKGVRENWKNPPCIKVDYLSDIGSIGIYISKYTAKNKENTNIVSGRVWSCSQSVSKAVEVFKKDSEFNKFWYQSGNEMMKRKVYETDYFSICKFKFTSLIAWFTDVKKYITEKLHEVFEPCKYYQRSLGIIPI